MVTFDNNKLIIAIENIDKQEYIKMLHTLVWTIGHLQQEQELFCDIHYMSWLVEAMLPSVEQINIECKRNL